MKVLLIGPSNVGKTCYGQFAASEKSNCYFYDLDSLISKEQGIRASKLLPKIGDDEFFRISLGIIQNITDVANSLILVAVGAGTLQSSKSIILPKTFYSVLIYADPAEVYRRDRLKESRDFSSFYQTEYSALRKIIYNSTNSTLDVTGLSLKEAKRKFLDHLNEISVNAP